MSYKFEISILALLSPYTQNIKLPKMSVESILHFSTKHRFSFETLVCFMYENLQPAACEKNIPEKSAEMQQGR